MAEILNSETRQKNITKVSFLGIGTNIFLVIAKAIVGIIAGSISIILDAVNNLTDALSSVVALIGLKLSKKKPTTKHPFGFGRIEYFSSFIIGTLIIVTGVVFIIESIEKIITPVLPDYGIAQIVVISIAIVIKLLLGIFTRSKGKKYSSDALIGSGSDAMLDSLVSTTTLIGIIVGMTTGFSIDGIVGIVISLFVLKTGLEIIFNSGSKLIGLRPDAGITKEIKKDIKEIPGVIGVYDLVLHNYGPEFALGSVHIEVDSKLGIDKFHELTMEIQNTILNKYNIFLTVGLYSVNEETEKIRTSIKEHLKDMEGVLGVHGVFINKKKKIISMDVTIDFSVLNKKNDIIKIVEEEISKDYEGYKSHVSFDMNYSDL